MQVTLNPISQDDLDYEGFFDGQNLPVPDNSVFDILVTGGFEGIEEGKANHVCFLNLKIVTPGQFFGQTYKFDAKIFDMDATKRDRAMKNLGVIDAQAGFPMSQGQLPLTTENIEQYWAGKAYAKCKFGAFTPEDESGNPEMDEEGNLRVINFVRGFAYDRAKMLQPGQENHTAAAQHEAPETYQEPAPEQADEDEDDIDF